MTMDDIEDRLIKRYADELQRIYDKRTAGDYTFTGVLSTFLIGLKSEQELTSRSVSLIDEEDAPVERILQVGDRAVVTDPGGIERNRGKRVTMLEVRYQDGVPGGMFRVDGDPEDDQGWSGRVRFLTLLERIEEETAAANAPRTVGERVVVTDGRGKDENVGRRGEVLEVRPGNSDCRVRIDGDDDDARVYGGGSLEGWWSEVRPLTRDELAEEAAR